MYITLMNEGRLDLNLLLVFEAMMRERSVTRAAERLGIGQPAVSNALGRLRVLLKDELFVRGPGGMVPTARALELAEPVETAMATLRDAVSPKAAFDPVSSSRRFTLSAGDYAAITLFPRLIARVRSAAPHVDLRFRFVEKDDVAEALDSGEIDVALGVFASPSKRFIMKPLLEETFACVVRAGHPVVAQGLTLESYAALPHLLVTERGDDVGAVDEVLRGLGLKRRVAITVPHLLLLPWFLCESDLIATTGLRAARSFAAMAPIAVLPPPLNLRSWRLSMLYSRQRSGDSGVAWLCGLLAQIDQGAVAFHHPPSA